MRVGQSRLSGRSGRGVFAIYALPGCARVGVYDGSKMTLAAAELMRDEPVPGRAGALRKHYFLDLTVDSQRMIVDGSVGGNWTALMNNAASRASANVVYMVTCGAPIFYVKRRGILPGEELTYFYETSSTG